MSDSGDPDGVPPVPWIAAGRDVLGRVVAGIEARDMGTGDVRGRPPARNDGVSEPDGGSSIPLPPRPSQLLPGS